MTEPSAPRVAIVVVSFNTCALLQRCLRSVVEEPQVYTIVVDNASDDGSAEMVERDFSQVELIRNHDNAGFARATNQGIRRALEIGVPYVMLLNPDAYLRPGALAALLEFMERHPRVGCAGARLFYPDGRPQEGAWRFPTPWMTLFDLFPPRGPLLGRLYFSALNGRYAEERNGAEPFQIDHPLGAAMLLRRAAIDEVGLLDESYWMYVEEVDWCLRCRRAGWAIWQVPRAEVEHVAGAATGQFRTRSFVALHRSRLSYARRYFSPPARRANRAIVVAGMLNNTLVTWLERLRGRLDVDELRGRTLAYAEVMREAGRQGDKVTR